MTLTLSLPPELETRLRDRAARAGKAVDAFVLEAVAEKLAAEPERDSRGRTAEEWIAEYQAWVSNRPPVDHFVDDSRESIYEDRG